MIYIDVAIYYITFETVTLRNCKLFNLHVN